MNLKKIKIHLLFVLVTLSKISYPAHRYDQGSLGKQFRQLQFGFDRNIHHNQPSQSMNANGFDINRFRADRNDYGNRGALRSSNGYINDSSCNDYPQSNASFRDTRATTELSRIVPPEVQAGSVNVIKQDRLIEYEAQIAPLPAVLLESQGSCPDGIKNNQYLVGSFSSSQKLNNKIAVCELYLAQALSEQKHLLPMMNLQEPVESLTEVQKQTIPYELQERYFEIAHQIKALKSDITFSKSLLQCNEQRMGTYQSALKNVTANHKDAVPGFMQNYIFENEVTKLQNYIRDSRIQEQKASHVLSNGPAKLVDMKQRIVDLDKIFWKSMGDKNELAELKNKCNVLSAEIRQAKEALPFLEKTIRACEVELVRLEPIIAYGKQCAKSEPDVTYAQASQADSFVESKQDFSSNASNNAEVLEFKQALEQTHKESRAIRTIEYSLSSHTAEALEKLGFDVDKEFVNKYTGNTVQHYIHEKLRRSLDKIGDISQSDPEVNQLLKSAVRLNVAGQFCNNQHKVLQALSAKDACDAIIDYAKTIADLGVAAIEGVVEGAKSTVMTSAHLVGGVIDLARCDKETVDKITTTFNNAVAATSKFAVSIAGSFEKYNEWLNAFMDAKYGDDHQEIAHLRDMRNDVIKDFGHAVAQKIAETPARDHVKAISQFATEWVLFGEIIGAVGETATVAKATFEGIVSNPSRALATEVAEVTAQTIKQDAAFVKGVVEASQSIEHSAAASAVTTVAKIEGKAEYAVQVAGQSLAYAEEAVGNLQKVTAAAQMEAVGQHVIRNTSRMIQQQTMQTYKLEQHAYQKIAQHFEMAHAELAQLVSKFDNVLDLSEIAKNIPGIKSIPLHFDYLHILKGEINISNKGELFLKGCHTMRDAMVKSGEFVFEKIDRFKVPDGFEVFNVGVKGFRPELKVFFPQNWSNEKIMSKIVESMRNGVAELTREGKIEIVGKIAEEIDICSVINPQTGEILSSFPSMFPR